MLMNYVIRNVVQPKLVDVHAYKQTNFKNNTELKPLEEVGHLFIDTIKINDPHHVLGQDGKNLHEEVLALYQRAGLDISIEKSLYKQPTNWDWRPPHHKNHPHAAEQREDAKEGFIRPLCHDDYDRCMLIRILPPGNKVTPELRIKLS